MGKYSSCLSTKQVCELEVEECKSILKKYKVSKSGTEAIVGMIEQAYYMLEQSYAMGRKTDAYIEDRLGQRAFSDFLKKITGQKRAGKHLRAVLEEEAEEFRKAMEAEPLTEEDSEEI